MDTRMICLINTIWTASTPWRTNRGIPQSILTSPLGWYSARLLQVVRATVENILNNPTKNCVLHRGKHEPHVVGVRGDGDVGVDGGPGKNRSGIVYNTAKNINTTLFLQKKGVNCILTEIFE